MTIGIGASCFFSHNQPRIILCSDARIEDEYIGSETCVKLESLGGHWICLVSGSSLTAKRLVDSYRVILNDVSLHITADNAFEIMSRAPRQLLTKLSEELIHDELRMSAEDFYRHGNSLGDVYGNILDRIRDLRLDCQLIIAGFINGKAQLFQVEENGQLLWNEHYVLIGSGTYEAHSILQQRSYVRTIELLDALYLVYEAKRWSEKARGVGNQNTVMQIVQPDPEGFRIGWIDPQVGIPFLEEKYKALNLQPVLLGDVLPSGFLRWF
jgi:20S proteasome alpha/beta subunit